MLVFQSLKKMIRKNALNNTPNNTPNSLEKKMGKKIVLSAKFRSYLIRNTEQKISRLKLDSSAFIDETAAKNNLDALVALLAELKDEKNLTNEANAPQPEITHIDLVSNGVMVKGYKVIGV